MLELRHYVMYDDAEDEPIRNWIPENGTLTTYAKGRGIGNCGTAERFVWDRTMYRLIKWREMNCCRGSPYRTPFIAPMYAA